MMSYHNSCFSAIVSFVLSFLSAPFALSAQSYDTPAANRPHHIMINALSDYTMVRDMVVSPLLYQRSEGGLTLGYEYRAMRHEHRVIMQMTLGRLTRPGLSEVPGGGSYGHMFLLGVQWNLEYSFAITALRTKTWYIGIGGMMDTGGDLRTYSHIWSALISFSSSSNIGPSIVAAWQPEPRHKLRLRLAIPVISIVKRPSWNFVDPSIEAQANKSLLAALYENSRVTTVHEWLRVSLGLKHEWEITELIQINTAYRITLLISNLPRYLGSLDNQVSLGISFRL